MKKGKAGLGAGLSFGVRTEGGWIGESGEGILRDSMRACGHGMGMGRGKLEIRRIGRAG